MTTASMTARVELAATVLTAATCLLLCALVVGKVYRAYTAPLPQVLQADAILTSTNQVPFDHGAATVLVSLRTTCALCTESLPALRRLERYVTSRSQANDSVVSLIAIGSEPVDTLAAYLDSNDLRRHKPVSVDRSSALSPVIVWTPAIVVVDRNGLVLDSFPGRVTSEVIERVISRIEKLLRERSDVTL